ncbi:FAM135A [Symbiodinium natans]|uniref:FAM135A protein n=1 Tax=Symbiodinium natans TaxID=878477 RepID=A0A812UKK8_9DINO|nr:FAM135A [Symbiodinium natans]
MEQSRLLQLAEGLYRRHLGALSSSYVQQAAWFRQICERCFTPLQREALFGHMEAEQSVVPPDLGISALRLPKGLVQQPPPGASRVNGSSAGISSLKPATGFECPPGGSDLQESIRERLQQSGGSLSPEAVSRLLAYDLNSVSCQILELWHQVLNVLSFGYREISSMLRTQWEERIIDQWSVSIIREKMSANLAEPDNKSVGESHTAASENLRKTVKPRPPELASIEDTTLLPPIEQRPVLFDQRSVATGMETTGVKDALHPSIWESRVPSAPKQYRGVHLFVLCHGFQGNSFDMRLMKNNIALLYPDAIFLCSQSNEDNTEGDFSEMGIRLAQEVSNFICDWCPGSALGRLSFIAHSIGGLIVRSAIPHLQEFKDKMFTFITFSSPHVGYFLKNISLFHLGLKVLQSWRGSQCLTQLSMADADDPRQTMIYKLSQTPGFEYFQNVVLVSCASDSYGPFDSARVEIGNMLGMHTSQEAYKEIVNNLWKNVKPERVFRFDVNFHIPENNLDTFIGRAAHIQFLECQPIMRLSLACRDIFTSKAAHPCTSLPDHHTRNAGRAVSKSQQDGECIVEHSEAALEDLVINPLGTGPFQLARTLEERRSKQLEDLDRVDRLWEFRLCEEMLRDCLDGYTRHGERDSLSTAEEVLTTAEELLRRITELAVLHEQSDEAFLDSISRGKPGTFAPDVDGGLLMQALRSPDFSEKGGLTRCLLSSRLLVSGLLESVVGELTCWRSHPSESDLQAWRRWDKTYERLASRVAAVQQAKHAKGAAANPAALGWRCLEGQRPCEAADGVQITECFGRTPACAPMCGYGQSAPG